MSEARTVNVTLSKEQAALLLPLLKSEAQSEDKFTIAEMFSRKKKNARSTPAQYLLVSLLRGRLAVGRRCYQYYNNIIHTSQSIVRESAKAANLWEVAPLLKDVNQGHWKVFFETVGDWTTAILAIIHTVKYARHCAYLAMCH